MTERINVNAAQNDGGPHMPSWMDEDAVTYAQAGVDTAEGARAVEAIKGVVHDTYRPEVVGDIGGFGGLFSIAAAKDMADPLLVSGTDGVGTKLKVAQLAGKHDTVGIDLVAMCANDILATGAEPLFFLDYVAIGKLKAENVAEIVGGHRRGLQAGRLRAHRRRDGRAPRRHGSGRLRPVRLLRGRGRPAEDARSRERARGRRARRPGLERPALQRLLAGPQGVRGGQAPTTSCASSARSWAAPACRTRLLDAHAHLREARARRAGCVPRRRARARTHHGRRHLRESGPRAARRACDAEVDLGTWPVPPIARFVCDAAHLGRGRGAQDVQHGPGHGARSSTPLQAGSRGGRPGRGRRDDVPRRPHRGGRAERALPCATRTKAPCTGMAPTRTRRRRPWPNR